MKKKYLSCLHCEKKDCLYRETCQGDEVQFFLCGKNKKYYLNILPSAYLSAIGKKITEILNASNRHIKKMADDFSLNTTDLQPEQLRMLVAYKLQEDIRNEFGLARPSSISLKVGRILYGITDSLLYPGEKEVSEMAKSKGTAKAKKKMAKVREAKGSHPKGLTVGGVATACIQNGLDFEATLKEVKKEFPKSQMKRASYNWYKSKAGVASKKKA